MNNVGSGGGSALDGVIGTTAGALLTPFLGPLAPIAGGLLGGLLGGGKPSGSNGGLNGALTSGLGSLFGSKSSSSAVQTVNVGQSTDVNVSNVLGGRSFGNYDTETGDFDTFQALSDIYAIKAAQDQARLANTPTASATVEAKQTTPLNWMPLILVGALAGVLILTRSKK